MSRLIFSLALVVVGIALGYGLQRLAATGQVPFVDSTTIAPLRKRLQQVALLGLNPIAIIGATWMANIENLRIIALPFLCITALVSGGCLALVLSKLFRMERRQTGAYLVCGSFTNIGSLGALFCFMFLGEAGFALVPLYKLFEEFSYFAFGFPLAKSYSATVQEQDSLAGRLRVVFTDIFVLAAVSSIGLGLLLNLSGLQRPEFYSTINSIFIPTTAFLLLLSIGMGMRFSSVGKYIRESSCIALVKFAIVPLIVVTLGYLLGLHTIDNGLPLKVVLILSSMPVGFIAMIPPTLYDLDVDLANSCWLVTNFLLLLEVPLLLFLISLIGG